MIPVIRPTACFLLLGLCLLALSPASAQNSSLREVINRLDRLQREVTILQRQVYRDQTPPRTVPRTDNRLRTQDTGSAKHITTRLTQLEDEIKRLTGDIEVLGHRVAQLVRTVNKLTSDVAEGSQQRSASAPPPASDPETSQAKTAAIPDAPVLPEGTAEEQYQFAADLLVVKNRVVAAEAALKEFIEKHPKHRRASNAWYWLGEAHFQRKRYREAAVAYGKGYSQHAQGAKAPDSLLKLGMSLGHLNMFDKACAAYARLLTKFPKAHPRLKQRVLLEQKRTKC